MTTLPSEQRNSRNSRLQDQIKPGFLEIAHFKITLNQVSSENHINQDTGILVESSAPFTPLSKIYSIKLLGITRHPDKQSC